MLKDCVVTRRLRCHVRFFQTEAETSTTLDKSSSLYSNIASGSNQTTAPDVDVRLTSSATNLGLVYDGVDLANSIEWIDESQPKQSMRSFSSLPGSGREPFDQDYFNDQISVVSDVSSIFSNPADFTGPPFLTPANDDPHRRFAKLNPAPSFLSLFNVFLETHKALTEISSGRQHISIEDLKDDSGVMRTLSDVGELGVTTANSQSLAIPSLQGSIDQGCLLFAFTAVLKACDLAEHILKAILPAIQPAQDTSMATQSSPMGFRGSIPFYTRPSRSMDDYPAVVCSPVTSEHPKLLAERITTLVRLDLQLSHFNQFVSKFIDLTRGERFSTNVSILQCQSRLLHLHTQIRTGVDSMTPTWHCKTL